MGKDIFEGEMDDMEQLEMLFVSFCTRFGMLKAQIIEVFGEEMWESIKNEIFI